MKQMTYSEKLRQVNKEAGITVVVLAILIVAWIVLGFGLSNVKIELFSMPIWVWGATFGIWIVAIIAAVALARKVFVDFSLEDEEESSCACEKSGSASEEGVAHE